MTGRQAEGVEREPHSHMYVSGAYDFALVLFSSRVFEQSAVAVGGGVGGGGTAGGTGAIYKKMEAALTHRP